MDLYTLNVTIKVHFVVKNSYDDFEIITNSFRNFYSYETF